MAVVDVVVVGGGAAGLAAAYELNRLGAAFLLVDAASRFGGVIRTDQADGFTLDAGPDSLLVQKPAALQLCEELGLGPRLISTLSPRTAYVLRGRLLPIPAASVLGIPTALTPWAVTRLLSPAAKLRMAAELLIPRGDATHESVGAFFRRRFGRAMVESIAEPLLAGIHGGDVDRLSVRSLFPRLVEAERTHRSVIRAMRSARAPRSDDGQFRSLPGGIEELVTTLVATLPASSLRSGTRVLELRGPRPYTVRVADGPAISARAVILATPAYVTADLLAGLDARLAARCAEIPYASTATVLLGYPAGAVRRPLPGSGFVASRTGRRIPLIAGSWVTSKWPGRAPAGRVLVRGFLGGARDPSVLSRTDAVLADETHSTFAALLGIDQRPTLTRVYRWERANPQHEVGHPERVADIDARLKHLPGLFLTGAGFRGVGIPDCIGDGRATARDALAWHKAHPSGPQVSPAS